MGIVSVFLQTAPSGNGALRCYRNSGKLGGEGRNRELTLRMRNRKARGRGGSESDRFGGFRGSGFARKC